MKIGFTELLLIFIVALIAVGPDRLPAYARKLGIALGQFRKYSEEATRDIKESIVEPLEEAQRPLREAMEPLEELDKTVRGNVKEVQDSFAGIGKKSAKSKTKPEAASDAKAAVDTDTDIDTNIDNTDTDSKHEVNTDTETAPESQTQATSVSDRPEPESTDVPGDAAEERKMDEKTEV